MVYLLETVAKVPRPLEEMMLFDTFLLKIWPYGVGVLLTFDFKLCWIPALALGGGGGSLGFLLPGA